MSAPVDKWPVLALPEGHGRWGFVAGPRSGTGYPSKAAALEAGEAARAKAIAKSESASGPADALSVLKAHVAEYEFDGEIAEAVDAVVELVEQQKRDAQLVAILLSYLNDNLSEREKGRLGAELMNRDLSDHDERRRAALARVGGGK